ncbi:MAG: DUF1570 domain-containing protein [Phycisphaerales bacterium]|nr:DUF1570 domain-containing protein [Phycisphaerales bacterium]
MSMLVGASVACVLAACASSGRPAAGSVETVSPAAISAPVDVPMTRESWAFDGAAGEIIRTVHYRMYTTERDPVIVRRIVVFLEHALTHYRTALGELPEPPQRLDTYLMDNRQQWAALAVRIAGGAADTFTRLQRGGFATRGIGLYYDLGLYDTLAIASHEGWHQYTQRTFRNSIPPLIEEGLATYMEGHGWEGATPTFKPWANLERFEQLERAARAGRLRSLGQLARAEPGALVRSSSSVAGGQDALLDYYAQAWAMIHFLNEGQGGKHAAALRLLLQDAASGELARRVRTARGRAGAAALVRREAEPVLTTYFGDLTQLDSAYQLFVDALVAPGTREAISVGRSPVVGRGE